MAPASHAHAALHERAQHGEEAPVGVLDGRDVGAVLGDVGVPVEQRVARHAHVVEPDPPVVDAVQPDLVPAVLDADAVEHASLLVAQRYGERVHAVVLAGHLELGEHRTHVGMHSGVADVVLARGVVGGGDDELVRLGVEDGGGPDGLDVRAVAGLGHREAAHDLPAGGGLEVLPVVALGAQLQHCTTPEAELHPELHQHRQVAHGARSRTRPPRRRCRHRRRAPWGTRSRSGRSWPARRRRP